MSGIADNLAAIRARIAAAAQAAGRPGDGIRLIAVSKTRPVADIVAAQAAGQTDFGENYLQEGLQKIRGLPRAGLCWHFIGPVQSNKTRDLAEHFDWVHTVDRLRIAERLSAQRPGHLPPLQVCVQVNISGEDSKSGCTPQDAPSLCGAVAALPRLQLRGLMAIPAPVGPGDDAREPFRRLRELHERLTREGLQLDTLSAGMSDDLEAAIAEGSTAVRIGTAIFGARSAGPA